jgi:hypothetical protein
VAAPPAASVLAGGSVVAGASDPRGRLATLTGSGSSDTPGGAGALALLATGAVAVVAAGHVGYRRSRQAPPSS